MPKKVWLAWLAVRFVSQMDIENLDVLIRVIFPVLDRVFAANVDVVAVAVQT